MRAYTSRYSARPGCPCCNVKNLHGYRARKSPSVQAAMRSGKRSQRSLARNEIRQALSDM